MSGFIGYGRYPVYFHFAVRDGFSGQGIPKMETDVAVYFRISVQPQRHVFGEDKERVHADEILANDLCPDLFPEEAMGDVPEHGIVAEGTDCVFLDFVVEGEGYGSILHRRQLAVVHGGFFKVHANIHRLAHDPYAAYCSDYAQCTDAPEDNFFCKSASVSLPDGVEFHSEQFRNQLHVCPLSVHPVPSENFFVDVGSEDFGDAQFFQYRIEAFGVGISAVRFSVDYEEVYVFCSAKAVEICDFLRDPFRACRCR